jgi:nitrous oxidase accessory protein NosD
MEMHRTLGLLAAAATMLLMLPTGQALANHVQCGDVIMHDMTLDSDLTCAGDGLTVGHPGATLDLAGHAIQGSGAGIGITASGETVEVYGGTIRGFGGAIDSDGPDALSVHDMLVEHNGGGITCMYTPECSVVDTTIRFNRDGAAINLHAPDQGGLGLVRGNRIRHNRVGVILTQYRATVTDNRIEYNSSLGVEIDYTAEVEMSKNVVAGNGGDGIMVSFLSSAMISNNQIERNGGDGIAVIGDFFFGDTSAVVRKNRIARNGGDGVLVEAEGAHAVVEGNRTDRNGDDGIDLDGAATTPSDAIDTVVRANRAFFNADLGIEAVAGTTDGGGNRAHHNGDPAQCVGVSCK